jgi:hypothetical protein
MNTPGASVGAVASKICLVMVDVRIQRERPAGYTIRGNRMIIRPVGRVKGKGSGQ